MAESSIPLTKTTVVKTVSIPVNQSLTNYTHESKHKVYTMRLEAELKLSQLLDAGYEIRYQTTTIVDDVSYWNFLLIGKQFERRSKG